MKKASLIIIFCVSLLLVGCGVTAKTTDGDISEYKKEYLPIEDAWVTVQLAGITASDNSTVTYNIVTQNESYMEITVSTTNIKDVSFKISSNYPDKLEAADGEVSVTNIYDSEVYLWEMYDSWDQNQQAFTLHVSQHILPDNSNPNHWRTSYFPYELKQLDITIYDAYVENQANTVRKNLDYTVAITYVP